MSATNTTDLQENQTDLFRIIIHGGYIVESNIETKPFRQESVKRILQQTYQYGSQTTPKIPTASEIAVYAVMLLENDPLFNAGTGSRIQSDGEIRMTASLIDSQRRKFSGVINIQHVKNPSQIALLLQNEVDSVLASKEAENWARQHGFHYYNPETIMRREEFERNKKIEHENLFTNNTTQSIALTEGNTTESTTISIEKEPKTGTVGCVVLKNGILASCTSTGGKGNEIPGRVSDSGNVSGCFANKSCGVSITGVGEDAMATSMASAICIRRDDGMTIQQALQRTIDDLNSINGISGAICLDINGEFAHEATTSGMVWGTHDGNVIDCFE